jgi:hypothetical protein
MGTAASARGSRSRSRLATRSERTTRGRPRHRWPDTRVRTEAGLCHADWAVPLLATSRALVRPASTRSGEGTPPRSPALAFTQTRAPEYGSAARPQWTNSGRRGPCRRDARISEGRPASNGQPRPERACVPLVVEADAVAPLALSPGCGEPSSGRGGRSAQWLRPDDGCVLHRVSGALVQAERAGGVAGVHGEY